MILIKNNLIEERNSNAIALIINNLKQDFAKKKLLENRDYGLCCSFAKSGFNNGLIVFSQILYWLSEIFHVKI